MATMNVVLSSTDSSEPLADLVRQMMTSGGSSTKRRREPELKVRSAPPAEDDGFPPIQVKQAEQRSFLKSASSLSVLAVVSYLMLLAV